MGYDKIPSRLLTKRMGRLLQRLSFPLLAFSLSLVRRAPSHKHQRHPSMSQCLIPQDSNASMDCRRVGDYRSPESFWRQVRIHLQGLWCGPRIYHIQLAGDKLGSIVTYHTVSVAPSSNVRCCASLDVLSDEIWSNLLHWSVTSPKHGSGCDYDRIYIAIFSGF